MDKSKFSDLIRDGLTEDRTPELDAVKAQAFAVQMQKLFPNFHREERAPEEQLIDVLGESRWRQWKQQIFGAVRVTVAAGERSRIRAEQALESFLGVSALWNFAGAGALRGSADLQDPGWLETGNAEGQAQASITVEEEGAGRILVATLHSLPAGELPPVLLVRPLDHPAAQPVLIEAVPLGRAGMWQYRAELNEGDYAAVFGPR